MKNRGLKIKIPFKFRSNRFTFREGQLSDSTIPNVYSVRMSYVAAILVLCSSIVILLAPRLLLPSMYNLFNVLTAYIVPPSFFTLSILNFFFLGLNFLVLLCLFCVALKILEIPAVRAYLASAEDVMRWTENIRERSQSIVERFGSFLQLRNCVAVVVFCGIALLLFFPRLLWPRIYQFVYESFDYFLPPLLFMFLLLNLPFLILNLVSLLCISCIMLRFLDNPLLRFSQRVSQFGARSIGRVREIFDRITARILRRPILEN